VGRFSRGNCSWEICQRRQERAVESDVTRCNQAKTIGGRSVIGNPGFSSLFLFFLSLNFELFCFESLSELPGTSVEEESAVLFDGAVVEGDMRDTLSDKSEWYCMAATQGRKGRLVCELVDKTIHFISEVCAAFEGQGLRWSALQFWLDQDQG
jgi:hypothetical protein